MESKMENSTHSSRKMNLVFQKERGYYFYRLYCLKEMFLTFAFYFNHSFFNTLSEYTYFYISKNIHTLLWQPTGAIVKFKNKKQKT